MNPADEKKVYGLLLMAPALLAVMVAILIALHQVSFAIITIAFSVAALPLVGHFRMRRMLSSLRRANNAVFSDSSAGKFQDLASIEAKLDQLIHYEQAASNNPRGNLEEDDLVKLANEMRRESRYLRLAAFQVRNKLNGEFVE